MSGGGGNVAGQVVTSGGLAGGAGTVSDNRSSDLVFASFNQDTT